MNVAVIGVGLIGGSIAIKLRKNSAAQLITGTDKSVHHLNSALKAGIIDRTAALDEAVAGAELILLTVPVDAAVAVLPHILDIIHPSQTVMDAGSTKAAISDAVKNHRNRSRYVAFHPMWGTENSGPDAATGESFTERAAVICDPELSSADALSVATKVCEALEMHPIYMSSAAHDVHTAYISHISHITSYALANTVLEKEREEETIFQLASSGFSSTVRLAKSHPEMWVPIFQQNKENVLDVLNEHITQLRKFKAALEKENYGLLEELIRNANRIRPILDKN